LDLRLNFGQFLLEQNEFERAAEQFDEAVRLDRTSVLAHTGLGLAVLQQKRPDAAAEALPHFEAAVKLSPDDPVLNLNLAVCLMRVGRAAEARPYFDKANSLNPEPTATEEPGRREKTEGNTNRH
jgi:Flp pilus assembly protein TadD